MAFDLIASETQDLWLDCKWDPGPLTVDETLDQCQYNSMSLWYIGNSDFGQSVHQSFPQVSSGS